MYNLQLTTNRILKLTQSKKLSVNQMLKNAGLAPSILANMKRGRLPSIDKIHVLADYLDCCIDYLIWRTHEPDMIITSDTSNVRKTMLISETKEIQPILEEDEGEKRLLNVYRGLNEANKIEVQVQARLFLERQHSEEKEREKILI